MAARQRKKTQAASGSRSKTPVLSFSPIGLLACHVKLWDYSFDKAGRSGSRVYSAGKPTDEERRAVNFAERHLAKGVLVVAAGGGDDVPHLQSVLDKANVGIKLQPQPHDAMIGVSSVAYRFEWDMGMKVQDDARPDNSFRLKGVNNTCFLTRVFAKTGFDTLVSYVDPEASCDMNVTFIGMPDQLPDSLQGVKDADQIRIALDGLYKSVITRARPVKNPPPLGVATAFDVDGLTHYNLPDVVGKPLANNDKVTEARHVCRLFTNKDGGGVFAGTVEISKGISLHAKPPVNLDFRTFRNGYLELIEMSHSNKATDNVALVIGWVNPPKSILAVL